MLANLINSAGTILIFVLVISVLVFVHEYGHYWFARRYGIKVEVFSIGFGRRLFGRTDRHGTEWIFCLIPLGGYVRMRGMEADTSDEHSSDQDSQQPNPSKTPASMETDSFDNKTLGQRSWVIFGGPLFNYLFAFVLFVLIFRVEGAAIPPDYATQGIGGVQSEGPAAQAGLQEGDVIVRLNDKAIDSFTQIIESMNDASGAPITVTYVRRGDTRETTLIPQRGGSGYILGVFSPQPTVERVNLLGASWHALKEIIRINGAILSSLGGMFTTGDGIENIGGPIQIAQLSYQYAQSGLMPLLLLSAMLSINLGLINLFPIPILDGGRLVMFAVEAVIGRRLSLRARTISFRVGLAILLLIFTVAMSNDIGRFLGP